MAYLISTVHPAAVLRGTRPIGDVIAADLGKAWRVANEGPQLEENIVHVIPGNPAGIERALDVAIQWMQHWRGRGARLGVDVETSALDYFNCKLYSIALAEAETHTAVAFTLSSLHTLPPSYELALERELKLTLADEGISKVFHNAPFDMAVLYRRGYNVKGRMWDTQGLHHLVQPDIPHDLGWVGHTYLDVEPWKLDHESGKMANTKDPVKLLIYNARDALYTAMLVEPLLSHIEARGMHANLAAWQASYASLAADMENFGIWVNQEKRKEIATQLRETMAAKRHWLREWLSWPDFNPMADHHRREVLFGKKYAGPPWNLGLKPSQYTEKRGEPSTSYRSIIDYLEHPFVRALTDYVDTRMAYAAQYKDGTEKDEDGKQEKPGSYQQAMQDDGRLHARWKPNTLNSVRFGSEPNCLSADTEILTIIGWVPFPEAARKRLPAIQYFPDTMDASIAMDTAYTSRAGMSRGISLKSSQLDLLMTEDHRCLIEQEVTRSGQQLWKPIVFPANALFEVRRRHKAIPCRANAYTGGAQEKLPHHLIAVLCACQADGWRRKYGNGSAWAFYFSKRRKIDRLKAALTACGPTADWYAVPLGRKSLKRKKETAIYIKDCQLKTWLDDKLSSNKELGPWILDLDTETLRRLVHESSQWDGSHKKATEYSTTVSTNADWIQIAGLVSGARTGMVHGWYGTRSKKRCYTVRSGPKTNRIGLPGVSVTDVAFDNPQDFYCATVPSGFIFVRRNGKPCITGNCQNQRKRDRAFFQAPDGKVLIGSDKDQLELRIVACRAGERELLEEMARPGGDPHRLAASKIYGEAFFQKSPEEQAVLRSITKNVVYAALYLAGVVTVWRTIRNRKPLDAALRAAMTLPVVRHVHSSYFMHYSGITRYNEWLINQATINGVTEIPPFGRRRYWPIKPVPATEVANWNGQCYPKTARIHTVAGLIPIIEAAKHPVILPTGETTSATLRSMGGHRLLEVQTADRARPYRVSENHVWLCQTEDTYEYREAYRLQPGDRICLPLSSRAGCFNGPRVVGLLYWLAAWLSDGYTTNYGYDLFFGTSKKNRDPMLCWKFFKFACQAGWRPQRPVQTKANLMRVRIGQGRCCPGRSKFNEALEAAGYDRSWTARTKRVPELVFRSGVRGAREFLLGFLEGDFGQTVKRKTESFSYGFHSPNLALQQDLLSLATYAGVRASIGTLTRPGPKPEYEARTLTLHSYDVDNAIFGDRLKLHSRGRIAQGQLLPRAAADAFLWAMPTSGIFSRESFRTLHHRLKTGGLTHPWTLREMYIAAEAPIPPLYDSVGVVGVKQLEVSEQCYTLTVHHPLHQYTADGSVTRNCPGAEIVTSEMVIIQDELKRKYQGASIIAHKHDELNIECFEKDAEAIAKLVKDVFGNTRLDGPAGPVFLTASAKIGKTMKDIK